MPPQPPLTLSRAHCGRRSSWVTICTRGRAGNGRPWHGEVTRVASDDTTARSDATPQDLLGGGPVYCGWSSSGRFGRSSPSRTSGVLRLDCADRSARRAKYALRACPARRARSAGDKTPSGSIWRSNRSNMARRAGAVRALGSAVLAHDSCAASRAMRERSEVMLMRFASPSPVFLLVARYHGRRPPESLVNFSGFSPVSLFFPGRRPAARHCSLGRGSPG